jgi:hypothetical protein
MRGERANLGMYFGERKSFSGGESPAVKTAISALSENLES